MLEEQAAQALMTIAMDGTGRVVAIEQLGEGEVDFMTVKSILKVRSSYSSHAVETKSVN